MRYPSGSSSTVQVSLTGCPDLADSSQASAIFETAAVILPVTDMDAFSCTTSKKCSSSRTYPSLCLVGQYHSVYEKEGVTLRGRNSTSAPLHCRLAQRKLVRDQVVTAAVVSIHLSCSASHSLHGASPWGPSPPISGRNHRSRTDRDRSVMQLYETNKKLASVVVCLW